MCGLLGELNRQGGPPDSLRNMPLCANGDTKSTRSVLKQGSTTKSVHYTVKGNSPGPTEGRGCGEGRW